MQEYSELTLTYKLISRKGEQLTAATTTDPGRLLTQKMLEQSLDAPPVTYIDADIDAYTARMVKKEAKKAAKRAAEEQAVTPTTQPTSISATVEEPPMKS